MATGSSHETVIHRRIALANTGKHPSAIIRLKSGWVVAADTQPVEGYCLLLSDPVVKDLNALSEADRAFDPQKDKEFIAKMREFLAPYARADRDV